jgi:hypothetical protein
VATAAGSSELTATGQGGEGDGGKSCDSIGEAFIIKAHGAWRRKAGVNPRVGSGAELRVLL